METKSLSQKKPMASVRKVSLFHREIKERISPAGFELLLSTVHKISEGQIAQAGHYYGSTMITIDLERVQRKLRESCDVVTTARLARLLQAEKSFLNQLENIALEDARKIAHQPLHQLETDIRMRTEGCRLLVDVDVEGEAVTQVAMNGK